MHVAHLNVYLEWEDKMVQGRCMRCKRQVEIVNAQEIRMKNGMRAARGTCPICNTIVMRIIGR